MLFRASSNSNSRSAAPLASCSVPQTSESDPAALPTEHRIEHELPKCSGGHATGPNIGCAHPGDSDHAARDQENHQRGQPRAHGDPAPRDPIGLLDRLPAMRQRIRLGGECLHDKNFLQHLADDSRRIRDPVLALPRQTAEAAAQQHQRCHHRRHEEGDQDGEFGTRHQHHRRRTDQQEYVAERDRDGGVDGTLHHRHIGGQSRDHLAGTHRLEEGRAHPQQMVEQPPAQVRNQPLADHADEIEAGRGRQREGPGHRQQGEKVAVDQGSIAIAETVIDDPAEGDREGEREECGGNQGDSGGGEHPPPGAQIGPEPQQRRDGAGARPLGRNFGSGHG